MTRTYSKEIETPLDEFKRFNDDDILSIVLQRPIGESLRLTMTELMSFSGLQGARGLYRRHASLHFLCRKAFGAYLLYKVMHRPILSNLLFKHLRFDENATRLSRK